jgi:hypothetical protein
VKVHRHFHPRKRGRVLWSVYGDGLKEISTINL